MEDTQNGPPHQATDCAVAYLSAISNGLEGYVQLAAADPDNWNAIYTCAPTNDLESLRPFIERWAGIRNLYYTINPLREALTRKPTKADVIPRQTLADIDMLPNDDHEGWRQRTRARIEQFAITCGEHPIAINDSGGGFQLLFRLPEVDQDACERTGERIAILLGVVLPDDMKIDSTFSVEHLGRLPGTLNLPDQKKRDMGRVARMASNVALDPAAITQPVSEPAKRGTFLTTEQSGSLPPEVDEILRLGRRTYPDGTTVSYKGDRSAIIAAVAYLMFSHGYTDEEIFDTLAKGYMTGKRVDRKGDDHTLQDIARLRDKSGIKPPLPPSELDKIADALTKVRENGDAADGIFALPELDPDVVRLVATYCYVEEDGTVRRLDAPLKVPVPLNNFRQAHKGTVGRGYKGGPVKSGKGWTKGLSKVDSLLMEGVRCRGVTFRPDIADPTVQEGGELMLNTYRAPIFPADGGSADFFSELCATLWTPGSPEYVICVGWLANLLAHPEWRMHALVLVAVVQGMAEARS